MSTPDDAPLVPDAVEDEAGAAPKRVSRKAKVWGWAGVALLVGVASWFGWQSAQQAVRWEDVGFKVVSPTEAQATFKQQQVDAAPAASARARAVRRG